MNYLRESIEKLNLDKQTANELRLVNPVHSNSRDVTNGVRESKQLPKKEEPEILKFQTKNWVEIK